VTAAARRRPTEVAGPPLPPPGVAPRADRATTQRFGAIHRAAPRPGEGLKRPLPRSRGRSRSKPPASAPPGTQHRVACTCWSLLAVNPALAWRLVVPVIQGGGNCLENRAPRQELAASGG